MEKKLIRYLSKNKKMSKLQKQQIKFIPQSVWDDPIWSKETYQKHEVDFQKILSEYRNIKHNCVSAIEARWRWMQSRGGISLHRNKDGILEPQVIESKYKTISNMFDKFSEWLSFKEKREMTPEEITVKLNEIKTGIKKVDFSIPNSITNDVQRDVSYEEEKKDEMLESALSNL